MGKAIDKEAIGSVRHLETEGMTEAALEFKASIDEFSRAKRKVEKTTTNLLSTWVGKGRNSFEVQYKLLYGQLKDIEDELYAIYTALIDSETAYYDADQEIRKQIDMAKAKV